MNAPDRIRLRHMLDAAREALSFAAGRAREDLSSDRMLLLSVIKEIEIIGEAANQVSAEFRKSASDGAQSFRTFLIWWRRSKTSLPGRGEVAASTAWYHV